MTQPGYSRPAARRVFFCLGSHLARRSQRALFSELIGRLDEVELAAPPERLAASFVAGIKHLHLRYRLQPHR